MNHKEQIAKLWKERIASFLSSGLTRSEFCDKNNIAQHQLLYWLGKHYEAASNLIPVKITNQIDTAIPVSTLLCKLKLSTGTEVTIHDERVLGDKFTDLLARLSTVNSCATDVDHVENGAVNATTI